MSGSAPLVPPGDGDPVRRLQQVVRLLRGPGGCPWDREQTHASLVPHLLEEAYEAVEALRSDDGKAMEEELGDVLLQVVMQAQIASETGRFDLDSVAVGIAEKLVRRHPHVFGGAEAEDASAVLRQWEAIKRREKGTEEKPYLHGVGKGLPSLMTADRLQRRAAKAGFDWPSPEGALAKVGEELGEVREALEQGDSRETEEELGDLLFAVVNLVRRSGFDAEAVLAAANGKFRRRFDAMQLALAEDGMALESASLEQMDAVWDRLKNGERAAAAQR